MTNKPNNLTLKRKTFTDVYNAAIASSFVTMITQPLQVLRTNMLVTYKNTKVISMTEMFKKITYEEGFRGFYRGFIPSMVKTVTGSVIYFVALEQIKDIIKGKNTLKIKNNKNDIILNFLSSGLARTIQSVLINPLLIAKTRIEVVGVNNYTSLTDALIKIKKEEGYRGYFKGLKQALLKDVPHSAIFFSLYEFFKHISHNYLNIKNLQIQVAFSTLVANIILTSITNPIEVLRTRVQFLHISKNSQHEYKGIVSGVYRIAVEEGMRGLCAGIILRFIKKAIGSVLIWTSYETLKSKSEVGGGGYSKI